MTAREAGGAAQELAYRPDIDGLRAVAIACVVMFHAGFNDWKGGYVGVDVFFVVSGFLIGSLLIAQARADGRLDAGAFMLRRMRRLAPPAIPPLLACLVLGAAFFAPEHVKSLAGAAAAAGFYVSNYFFMSELDYFVAAPQTKPLLHFWSLSIEMQFYGLCFAAAWLTLRLSRTGFERALLVVASGACLASFLVGQVVFARFGAEIAFFDTASRLWELFLGVALAATPWRRRLPLWLGPTMRVAGLSLIVLAALRYDSGVAGPGAAMLAPTLGTVLIIAAPLSDRDPTLLALRSWPLVQLGLVSYSLYLWHWPVFSAMHFYFLDVDDSHRTAAIACSLVLAIVSYRFWERPIHTRRMFASPRQIRRLVAGGLGLVIALSVAAPIISRALPGRALPDATLAMIEEENASHRRRGAMYDGRSATLDPATASVGGCSFDAGNTAARLADCIAAVLGDDDDRAAVLVIGDSHARDAYWTLAKAFPRLRLAFLHHGGGCGVARHRSLRIGGRLCYAALAELFAELSGLRRIDGIAIATRFYAPLGDGPSYALRSLEARSSLGAPMALPMLIFGPSPSFNYALTRYMTSAPPARAALAERGALPLTELHYPLRPARDALRDGARGKKLFFAERLDAFCGAKECEVVDSKNGAPLFADAEHLTRWGRERLAESLADDPGMGAFIAAVERRARR